MELCFSGRVLDDSPLKQYFLGQPHVLWDKWDTVVANLGKKVRDAHWHDVMFGNATMLLLLR